VKARHGLNVTKTNDNKKIIYCDFSDFEKSQYNQISDTILVTIAQQTQQKQEHIDEIKIEIQRTHNDLAAT